MTVYNPVNAAGIIDDINNNATSNGDIVNLPDGAHDIDSDGAGADLIPTAGVTINGGTATVLTTCKLGPELAGSANVLTLDDFTIDVTGMTNVAGLAACVALADGTFVLNDMTIGVGFTAAGNKTFAPQAKANATFVTCNDCEFSHGATDTVSGEAANQGLGEASLVIFNNCNLHDCGDGANDQVLTSHEYLTIVMNGGQIHSPGAGNNLVIPTATAPIKLLGVTLTEGESTNVLVHDKCTLANVAIDCIGPVLGCTITNTSYLGITTNATGVRIAGNTVDSTGGGGSTSCIQPVHDDAVMDSNVCKNALQASQWGIRVSTDVEITNNYVIDCVRAIYIRDAADPTILLANNIVLAGAGNEEVFQFDGGSPTITTRNNIFGTSYTQTGFAKHATDLEVLPDIDADLIPLKGGNCDVGQGYPLARPGVGNPDLYGRPKLEAYRDCIGPVYPQYERPENILHPTVQIGLEI